jgi:hypothetical protein
MAARRIFLYAVIFLALSITVFGINLLFFAKPLYALYADLFQSGQMYQGETRALMYNRFLLTVIAPCSFFLGSALTWLFITFKWVAWASTALILILVLLVAAFLHLEPVLAPPAPLRDHPNAHWIGGVDGGVFFEITRAEPPWYFVEIRYENSDIWAAGWVSHQGHPLINSDFWAYNGGNVVYLKNEKQLQLENKDGTPIDMD